ncbi:hypothetical protein [Armatimonas sp.]|uniref:hypothetical protein n=1 Tax=Armatimonas sp. TaxID=1872638 RepID=UPI0037536110
MSTVLHLSAVRQTSEKAFKVYRNLICVCFNLGEGILIINRLAMGKPGLDIGENPYVYDFRPPTAEEKSQLIRWLATNCFSGDVDDAKRMLSSLRLVVLPNIVSGNAGTVTSTKEGVEESNSGDQDSPSCLEEFPCGPVGEQEMPFPSQEIPVRSDVLLVTWPELPPRVSAFYWDQDRLISTEEKERQIRHAALSTSQGLRLLLEDLHNTVRRWEAPC